MKVGLEPTQPGSSSSMGKSNLVGKHSETESPSASRRGAPMPLTCDYNKTLSIQAGGAGDFVPTKVSFAGGSGSTESIPQWHIDELFGLNEFNQTYDCMDNGTSKVCSSLAEFLMMFSCPCLLYVGLLYLSIPRSSCLIGITIRVLHKNVH